MLGSSICRKEWMSKCLLSEGLGPGEAFIGEESADSLLVASLLDLAL